MSLTLNQLEDWDNLIIEKVNFFNLNPYPQEFEICDHFEMLGYMSYGGIPSRYPHWSFGKSYEKEKTLYDYGVGGLPYEMVINTNPCLAYLMRDNTDLLQVLTIAHVYGHNDFFANNFTFTSGIPAIYAMEMFSNHASRIRSYIEDPSIGVAGVEKILDAAHSLSYQRTKNLAIVELSREELQRRKWDEAQTPKDEFSEINPASEYNHPNLNKTPIEPEQNILKFIANNHPTLEDWQRDILLIVDKEASYFIPQIETKIMNEGWASYWHYKILKSLNLSQEMHLEFIVRHNQVLRPTPGGINPYHLGFLIWQDIEKRWNEQAGFKSTYVKDGVEHSIPEEELLESPGRQKMFEVRESDRDVSFLRRFLTKELMRETDMFQHERRGKERVITKISDDDNWKTIRDTMLKNVAMGSMPVILIEDADYDSSRTLYLKHEHDGRDLQLEHSEKTLKHLNTLWGRNVFLETTVNGKNSILKLEDQQLKIEKI